jgi:hypothetical protein
MTGPVELAPGEFVLFVSQGGTEEQDSRFLALLKEAWERVPLLARRVILEHHSTAYHYHPKVILGARPNSMWPIAMAGPEGSLLWCDLLRILDLPGKDPWAVVVIGRTGPRLLDRQPASDSQSAPAERLTGLAGTPGVGQG